MTSSSVAGRPDRPGPWQRPVDPARYDTAPLLRMAEKDAIIELGIGNLRRLARHDPAARGWQQVRRLLRPLDDAAAALEALPTSHRRRAMLDATAVVLLRCAETGRSYWAWTEEEWAALLGQDQHGFRTAAPGWADDAVRPYLAAHAFLLGGFTAFCRLGSFSRLTLAWRVFGRDRVNGEIGRIRSVLAGWGYRLGRDDDQLLPMVACQMLLLNRSPHLEDLSTGLFERVRRERLLPAARGNTLHAMQRAVAELVVTTPAILSRIAAETPGGIVPVLWTSLFGDAVPPAPVIPNGAPFPADGLRLDGHELFAHEVGHSDTDDTSILHAPSIGLVVAGDVVYNNVHQYVAEGRGGGIAAWQRALDTVAGLSPRSVVAGHKDPRRPDLASDIDQTRRYLDTATVITEKSADRAGFYASMKAQYPDRVNPWSIWLSALRLFPS